VSRATRSIRVMPRTETQTLSLVAEAVAEGHGAPLAARAPDEINPPITDADERIAFSDAFRREFTVTFVSAAQAGAGRERERCGKILHSPEAAGRHDAALAFATESDMLADEAIELLGSFPAAASRFGFIGDVVGEHGLTFREIVVGRNPRGYA
jgi:hypothetical protein